MKLLIVKNKADVAEIFINGNIVDDDEGGWIKEWRYGDSTGYEFPSKLQEQLNAVKDKPLEIHINSQGGSVFAGVAMSNLIANHKPKTTAIVDGIAASIASQIFFSADECKIPENAYVMLHRPFSLVEGNAEELRKVAEILDTLQEGLETTYRKKALDGVTDEDIHEMMNQETWLTGAQTAEKFKVEVLNPLPAVNCAITRKAFQAMNFKNVPASINFAELKTPPISDEERLKLVLARAKGVLV